ncbi:Hypothetical predicted protein [Mytilus galloprovincialis]|uniref:Uncharacterized protein n=1 Tax=Mytilus galloprovincialis TaxID=29158 RepID=A0A8B6GVH0_MYTGA|nr:Hypothetical predicted protein [Mytilus galloprovincialis]
MSQTTSSSSGSCNFSATLPSQIPNPFSVVSQQPHHYQFQQSTSPGINMFPPPPSSYSYSSPPPWMAELIKKWKFLLLIGWEKKVLVKQILITLKLPSHDRSLAKFMLRQQRDKVRKNSPKLKDTNISISEHFPKSVHEKRKTLIPMYKKAKLEGKSAFLTRDKLYIEGNLIVNTDEQINKTIRINSHSKSSRSTKNTHKSDNSTTGAQSAPGYLGTNEKATKSRIPSKISSPKASSSSQNGSRFEILADMHTESD